MPKITRCKARMVVNSRGEKTIETEVHVGKSSGRYAAPSGISKGTFEAPPFPPEGLTEAIKLVQQEIAPRLVGFEFSSQREVDNLLRGIDGTENYSRIGGATAVTISIATAEAAAKSLGIPLYQWLVGDKKISRMPIPLGNIVGGGTHSLGRASDIQEFLAAPLNAKSYAEAFFSLINLHERVGELLVEKDQFFLGGRNDEGAWTSSLAEEEILTIMEDAARDVRRQIGIRFGLGLDIAASSLWNPRSKLYVYKRSNILRTRDEQMDYVEGLMERFNLFYIEDPLHEKDFQGFTELTTRCKKVLICGDDLYVTSISRLMLGTSERAGNAVIIKPNQVGDITGSARAVELARNNGFKIVVSHRSGDTPTSHLAHIALAFESEMIKTGVIGGERVVKHNELIRLESEKAEFSLVEMKL